jgi:hypothetical protein
VRPPSLQEGTPNLLWIVPHVCKSLRSEDPSRTEALEGVKLPVAGRSVISAASSPPVPSSTAAQRGILQQRQNRAPTVCHSWNSDTGETTQAPYQEPEGTAGVKHTVSHLLELAGEDY